jgi:hypothetical protein
MAGKNPDSEDSLELAAIDLFVSSRLGDFTAMFWINLPGK